MPLTHLAEPRPHHLPHPPTTNITIGEDTYTVLGESHIVLLTSEYQWKGKTLCAIFLFFFGLIKMLSSSYLPIVLCGYHFNRNIYLPPYFASDDDKHQNHALDYRSVVSKRMHNDNELIFFSGVRICVCV